MSISREEEYPEDTDRPEALPILHRNHYYTNMINLHIDKQSKHTESHRHNRSPTYFSQETLLEKQNRQTDRHRQMKCLLYFFIRIIILIEQTNRDREKDKESNSKPIIQCIICNDTCRNGEQTIFCSLSIEGRSWVLIFKFLMLIIYILLQASVF